MPMTKRRFEVVNLPEEIPFDGLPADGSEVGRYYQFQRIFEKPLLDKFISDAINQYLPIDPFKVCGAVIIG